GGPAAGSMVTSAAKAKLPPPDANAGNAIREKILKGWAKPAAIFDINTLTTVAHQTGAFYEALYSLPLLLSGHFIPYGGWGHNPTTAGNDVVSITAKGNVIIHEVKGSEIDGKTKSKASDRFDTDFKREKAMNEALTTIRNAENLPKHIKDKA